MENTRKQNNLNDQNRIDQNKIILTSPQISTTTTNTCRPFITKCPNIWIRLSSYLSRIKLRFLSKTKHHHSHHRWESMWTKSISLLNTSYCDILHFQSKEWILPMKHFSFSIECTWQIELSVIHPSDQISSFIQSIHTRTHQTKLEEDEVFLWWY